MLARTGSGVVATARAPADAPPLQERELVALWLLGRVPEGVLPWPLLRPGRAGRGPGPDVREAAFGGPDGVVLCGDVEVHLAAGDFVHHGHLDDPAYADVVLHLVWRDDRPERGTPQPLPGGGSAPTVEVGPALGHDPARLRRLVRRGPTGAEPCADAALARGPAATSELVRAEGRRRLAERTWRAADLAAAHGWDGAWDALLDGALLGSAGRRRETPAQRAVLAARLTAPLAPDVLRALRVLALDGGARPRVLIGAFRAEEPSARAAPPRWAGMPPCLCWPPRPPPTTTPRSPAPPRTWRSAGPRPAPTAAPAPSRPSSARPRAARAPSTRRACSTFRTCGAPAAAAESALPLRGSRLRLVCGVGTVIRLRLLAVDPSILRSLVAA